MAARIYQPLLLLAADIIHAFVKAVGDMIVVDADFCIWKALFDKPDVAFCHVAAKVFYLASLIIRKVTFKIFRELFYCTERQDVREFACLAVREAGDVPEPDRLGIALFFNL